MAHTTSELAALILRDAEQLRRNAQDAGVSAYVQRPVQREKPNTRFLHTTLRSVEHANKRAQEQEMWARHMHHRQSSEGKAEHPQQGGQAHPSSAAALAAVTETSAWDSGVPRRMPVDDVPQPSHRVRGRGGMGARMDEAGPSLPATDARERVNEDIALVDRRVRGPFFPPAGVKSEECSQGKDVGGSFLGMSPTRSRIPSDSPSSSENRKARKTDRRSRGKSSKYKKRIEKREKKKMKKRSR